MADWDPSLYLQYSAERTRPAAELLARVPLADITSGVDLGCGPGNSTALLKQRWPSAQIAGVDNSPAMLAQAGQAVMYGVIIGFMLLCFALVNLIGTWVITARAKAKAKRPKDAATMIAMRRILDNPKRAWRNVSGIALAVFIAGITSICGFFGSAAVVDDANDPFTVFIRDIGTGGILTLVFAAVLAAVSSGVMQAGSVYDQAGEYRMLVLEGTDVKTLNRARFIEVLTPLNIVVIVAGGCSMLLMAPLFAASMTEPATLASFFGGLVLCYALVSIGAFASNHVAASLNLTDYRADD